MSRPDSKTTTPRRGQLFKLNIGFPRLWRRVELKACHNSPSIAGVPCRYSDSNAQESSSSLCMHVLFRYACDIRTWCVADLWPYIDSSISHHITPDDTSTTSVRAWMKLLFSYAQCNTDRHNSSWSIKRINNKMNQIPTHPTNKSTIHLLRYL
jgi:hypothetical protein